MKRQLKLDSIAILATAALALAQQAPVVSSVADILRQARQEILDFQKAGGKNTDPGHPAEKWAQELWKWRDTSPGTADAAKATTEAVRLLVYADRFAEVQARVDQIPPDDLAWRSLTRVLLDSASRQKSYAYFFAKLQSLLSYAKDVHTRAAVQANLGRAFRKQGEEKKAEAALRAAIDLAGDSEAGKEAATQLYELLHLNVGQPAPSFSATAIGGGRLSLVDRRGKPVVLVFWGTYCMDCVAEVPLLKQLYSKYRERGLEIVGISLDDEPSKVERFVAEKGIGWPQICDGRADAGAIPKLYNVTGTPDLFVIDRAGNIAARLMSAKELDRQVAEVTASNVFPLRPQRDSWPRPAEIMERFAFALEQSPIGERAMRILPSAMRVEPAGKVLAPGSRGRRVENIADRAAPAQSLHAWQHRSAALSSWGQEVQFRSRAEQ